MSGASVAALLADLIDPATFPLPVSGAANLANAANRKHLRGLQGGAAVCEALRMPANPGPGMGSAEPDSQTFAAVRKPADAAGSEQRRGFSQDSQVSQGGVPTCEDAPGRRLAPVMLADAEAARHEDRRARLLRWGWAEPDAEALAARLARRDREADPRVSCADCGHFRPRRCGNYRRAGFHGPDVSGDLAGLLQRCLGFQAATRREAAP